MRASLKYIFLYLSLILAGFLVLKLIAVGIEDKCGFDLMADGTWMDSLAFLLISQLIPLYVFVKRKYASLSFKLNYSFGDDFSIKKLYQWSALACVGCLLFDGMLQVLLPLEQLDLYVFGSIPDLEDNNFIDVVSACVMAPLVEESVCRGAIERRLLEKYRNPWIGIVISAIIFSLLHFNFEQGIQTGGLILGWVYYRTRNLWPCIFIHALNNILATILPDGWTEPPMPIAIVVAIVSGAALLYGAKKIYDITRDRTPLYVPVELPPALPSEAVDQQPESTPAD